MKPIIPLVHAMYPLASVFLMILARLLVDGSRICMFDPVAHLSPSGFSKTIMDLLYSAFDLLNVARDLAKEGECEGTFVLHHFIKQLPSLAFL